MVNNAALLAGRQQLNRKLGSGDLPSQVALSSRNPHSPNQPPLRRRQHHLTKQSSLHDGPARAQMASIDGAFLTSDFDNPQPVSRSAQSSLAVASGVGPTSDRRRRKTPDRIQRLMQTPYSEWEPHLQQSVLQLITNSDETLRGSLPSSRRVSAADSLRKSQASAISRPESPVMFQSDDEDNALGYGDELEDDYMSAAEDDNHCFDMRGSNIERDDDRPTGVGGFKVEFYGQDRDLTGFADDIGLVRREQLKPAIPEQRTEWLEARFEALQENQCKDILLAMIHAIEPRKNRLYPYQKKGQPACQRPPWWPEELEYGKGPHHMQCAARRSLLVHLTFLPLSDEKAYKALADRRPESKQRDTIYTWWIDMLRDSVRKVRLIDKCAEDKLMHLSASDGLQSGKKRKQRQHAEDKIKAKKLTLQDIFLTAQDILDRVYFGDGDSSDFITTNDIPAILRKDKDSHPEHPSKSRKRSRVKSKNTSATSSSKETDDWEEKPRSVARISLKPAPKRKRKAMDEPMTEPDTDLDQPSTSRSSFSKPQGSRRASKAEPKPTAALSRPPEQNDSEETSGERALQTELEVDPNPSGPDTLTSNSDEFLPRSETFVSGYPQPIMLSAMPWSGDPGIQVNMTDYTTQMPLPTDGISPDQTQRLYDTNSTEQAWHMFPHLPLYSGTDEYPYGASTTAQSSFNDLPSNSFSTAAYDYQDYRGGQF